MKVESRYLVEKNRAFTYLAPILTEKSNNIIKQLVNVFIEEKGERDEKNKLLLLVKINELPWFTGHVNFLKSLKYFTSTENIDNKYILFTYTITEEDDLYNYRTFLKGKYSKLTEEYKKRVLSFHSFNLDSGVAKVLYRSEIQYEEWEKILDVKIPRTQEIGEKPLLKNLEFLKDKMYEKEEIK